MDIEEAIETLKNAFKCNKKQFEELGTHILLQDDEQEAIETLLTAYEKEKAKVERIKDKLAHLKILAKIENKDIDRIKEIEILLKEE